VKFAADAVDVYGPEHGVNVIGQQNEGMIADGVQPQRRTGEAVMAHGTPGKGAAAGSKKG